MPFSAGWKSVPACLKRAGREKRMLVEDADDQTSADPRLLRILARAHHIQGRLSQNPKLRVHGIAREEQVSAATSTPLSSLDGARHHHGHHQWPQTAGTYHPDIDAPGAAAAGKLGRTEKFRTLALASRAIALNSPGLRCSAGEKVNYKMAPERFS